MPMARECLKNPQIKRYILPQIGMDIRKLMVSDAVDSFMRSQSIKIAKNFSWKKVIIVLEAYAPPSRRSCAKGGNSEQRLFPYPVGGTAKTSPPPETALAEATATSSYLFLTNYSHFCAQTKD